jgi:hypothetical protein
MKNKILLVFLFTFISLPGLAQAEDSEATVAGTSVSTEESVAPAAKKKWKASVTSSYYSFGGTKAASNNLYSFGDTTLFMQLMSVQYQVSPDWTLLVLGTHMENYVETNMFGMTFRDKTVGFGDVLVDLIRPLYLGSSFMLFGDIGLSLPTGSIQKKNASNPALNYAYNMQPGSGTWDAQAGLTGLYLQPIFQAGAHLSTFQRSGRNENGYRLGALYKADAWLDVPVGWGLVPRVVGYYKHKNAIDGQDKTLGRTALTEFYHHDQRNWDVSAALKLEKTLMGGVTLLAEAGRPLYQDSLNSDGVVVSTNYYGSLAVSGVF